MHLRLWEFVLGETFETSVKRYTYNITGDEILKRSHGEIFSS